LVLKKKKKKKKKREGGEVAKEYVELGKLGMGDASFGLEIGLQRWGRCYKFFPSLVLFLLFFLRLHGHDLFSWIFILSVEILVFFGRVTGASS
jgi:hypothetical protein